MSDKYIFYPSSAELVMMNKLTGSIIYKGTEDYKYFVYKVLKYPNRWHELAQIVLSRVDIPGFINFIYDEEEQPTGYVTKYIHGFDLYGDRPFTYTDTKIIPPFFEESKVGIIEILRRIVFAGIHYGVFFSDITRRNFIISESKVGFIDFDTITSVENGKIVERPETSSCIYVVQEFLDFMEIKHTFDGDLNKLYDTLISTH